VEDPAAEAQMAAERVAPTGAAERPQRLAEYAVDGGVDIQPVRDIDGADRDGRSVPPLGNELVLRVDDPNCTAGHVQARHADLEVLEQTEVAAERALAVPVDEVSVDVPLMLGKHVRGRDH